ncbi:hypothetical protein LIER_15812 [Lithospermum erythrorhizon]|uniref:Uncharacterized protein n=1 Tax=Lithospermum erythrorhizon TaxID=34254 RepID=A0AAV3Q5S5_LITER
MDMEKAIAVERLFEASCQNAVAQFLGKIRWPKGRNLVEEIQLLGDGMPGNSREDCHRVEWFEVYQHKSDNVWNFLREVPNKVWW